MLLRLLRELQSRIRFAQDPVAYLRAQGARIGERVELYGGSIHTFGSEPYLVSIGDDVTISNGVEFVTHDGGLRVVRKEHPGAYYYAPITVGDRAFIGAGALILPGVSIGERSVIGAGAVVTRDVPAETVVAGNPAVPIKSTEEYGLARRSEWVDTSGLSPAQKRAKLEAEGLSDR
jgi:serine acetyltransferase